MLPVSTFIFNPQSLGGSLYSIDLFLNPSSQTKFLNINDIIQDTAANQYRVVAPTVIPASDGDTVTVLALTTDILPQVDSGFDSTTFTPGQVDLRPAFRTSGSLGVASLFSAPDFEWTVLASWVDSSAANQAQVGDKIVDSLGKEFSISFLDPTNRFNVNIRVTESERVGASPTSGNSTLYRATQNFSFFHGTEVTDPARTTIFHRDKAAIDGILKQLEDDIAAVGGGGGTGEAVEIQLINGSGGPLTKLTPVRVNSSGNLDVINPATEADAKSAIGLVKADITPGASGITVAAGRLLDITTTAVFNDVLYLSKSGGVTNVEPDIGVGGFVAGDFVIKLGVVSKNEGNPALKDLIINLDLVGQL